MTDILMFKNEKFGEIRTMEINGVVWFIGKDVAMALGYSNPRDAIAKHVDDEDKGVAKCDTPGGTQELSVINESGLYSLILSSKLETSKQFKHWVTSEVLPSIRKTGSYSISSMSKEEIEVKSKEFRLGAYDRLHALANEYSEKSDTFKQILDAYATKELAGEFLLPLPETEKTYSATEIGEMLGVSANRIGKIANKNGLKTDEYGKYFVDKSKFSAREVQVFRYNNKGMNRFKELLKSE